MIKNPLKQIKREGWCCWPWSAFLVDVMLQELHGRETHWPTGLGITFASSLLQVLPMYGLLFCCHLPFPLLSVINLFRYRSTHLSPWTAQEWRFKWGWEDAQLKFIQVFFIETDNPIDLALGPLYISTSITTSLWFIYLASSCITEYFNPYIFKHFRLEYFFDFMNGFS